MQLAPAPATNTIARMPFNMLVTADGRTPEQLVAATRGLIERTLEDAASSVQLTSLDHVATIGNGHMLLGAIDGPPQALDQALAALGALGSHPARREEDGMPVGPGTIPTP